MGGVVALLLFGLRAKNMEFFDFHHLGSSVPGLVIVTNRG